MSWSLRQRISKDRFNTVTGSDSQQHLVTSVLQLLKEWFVLNGWNPHLTWFWLNVCLGRQNSHLKVDYGNQFPSQVQLTEREPRMLAFRQDSFQDCNELSKYAKRTIPSYWIQTSPCNCQCTTIPRKCIHTTVVATVKSCFTMYSYDCCI